MCVWRWPVQRFGNTQSLIYENDARLLAALLPGNSPPFSRLKTGRNRVLRYWVAEEVKNLARKIFMEVGERLGYFIYWVSSFQNLLSKHYYNCNNKNSGRVWLKDWSSWERSTCRKNCTSSPKIIEFTKKNITDQKWRGRVKVILW